MRITSRFGIAALWFAIAAPGLAQPSGAPAAGDARWTAWLGCWQQLEESIREDNVVEPGTRDTVPAKGVVVCVTPSEGAAGATLRTILETQASLDETIVADGSSRTIDAPGCRGSQRARWSANGRRLFAHADLSCADGTRTISGVTTIAPGPVWVDIQVVETAGRETIRVRRYRRAPDQAYVQSRLTGEQLAAAASAAARQATSFTLDEVREAIAHVTPSAVEAALLETDAGFPLNAKRLQELDAAGVPDRIIDLMIALSFPDKFVVERRASRGGGLVGGMGWGWMDTGYSVFPYDYAPFGYGMWGRYDGYYYGHYGDPVYSVDTGTSTQPSGRGRVVDGLGYTRVRSREPQPRETGSISANGEPSGNGSGSSGGGVSSQGYSGGGSDSGRTAVPRPPG